MQDNRGFMHKLIALIALCLAIIALVCIYNSNVTSQAEAVKLAEAFTEQDMYCAGYTGNAYDDTYLVVFRDRYTHQIEKAITVDYDTAELLSNKY